MSGTLDLTPPSAPPAPAIRLGALTTPAMGSPYAYPTLPTLAVQPPPPAAPAAAAPQQPAPLSAGLPPRQLMAESGDRQFGPDGQPLTPGHFAGDQNDPPIGEAQVRASTAREVLGRHGMQLDMNRFLNDGAYNNQVGGMVREDLMARYGQSRVLADAAYNAGPGRVDQWIKQYGDPRTGKITPEEWAAQIPFPETRLYLHSTGAVRGNYADRPDAAAGGFQLPFDMKAVWDEVRAKQYGAQAEASAELKGLRESMDKLAAPPPEKQTTPPEKVWGSMAMALAAIGGALTHTPLATAMNAMAGVLNGFHDRDKEATEQAFTQWKAAHEAVMQATSLRMKMYEEAMRKITDAPKEAEALMRANAAALQDAAVQGLLAKGDLMGAAAVISGGVAAAQRMDQSAQEFQWYVKVQQRAQEIFQQSQVALQDLQRARATGDPQQTAAAEQRYRDILALGAPAATAARIELPASTQTAAGAANRDVELIADGEIAAKEKTGGKQLSEADKAQIRVETRARIAAITSGERAKATSAVNDAPLEDAEANLYADQILSGDNRPWSLLRYNKQALQQLRHVVWRRAMERGMTGEDLAAADAAYASSMREAGAIGTRVGAIEVSGKEVKRIASQVDAAYSALDRSEFRPYNALKQMVERGTNSVEQGRAQAADFALATAYARALNPQGVPRESDIEQAEKMMNGADSYERHMGVVNQMLAEVEQIELATVDARRQLVERIRKSRGFGVGGAAGPPPADAAGTPPVPNARKAPDGHWYVDDPDRRGKYLRVDP